VSEQIRNDAEIVAQLRQGEKGALVRLYDEYSGLVYGVARRILRDAAAAEDVVQEVFLQLWRKPGSFDEQRGRLAPWLAVVARHKALDVLRKLKFEVDADSD
jgi:RNA polymerase sigma-70 factor (ECF subfamily)